MKTIEVEKGAPVIVNIGNLPEGVSVFILTERRLREMAIISGVIGVLFGYVAFTLMHMLFAK